jgi:hypothetical protein
MRPGGQGQAGQQYGWLQDYRSHECSFGELSNSILSTDRWGSINQVGPKAKVGAES